MHEGQGLAGLFRDPVDLVQGQDAGDGVDGQVAQDGFHGFKLRGHLRMGGVGHMHQDIRAFELFQGGHESFAQVRRQVADEAHRVGQDDLPVLGKAQPPAGGVQCGKKLVLGQDVALGQGV